MMTPTDLQPNTTLPEILTDDKPVRYIGYVILIITLGVFGTWSFFAPIDSSALASGTVTVESHRRTIQHLDGGIVSKILVKDGDRVQTDQPLLLLDNIQIQAQLEMLRGQYIAYKSLSERLQAERDQDKKVHFSRDLSAMNDQRVQEAMDAQRHIFMARKNSHKGEMSVLQQRIDQLNSKISGLQAQRDSKGALVRSYAEEISDLQELLAEGFTEKQRLRELQRNLIMTQGEVATLTSEIATTEMQSGETRLQVLQSEKELQENVAQQLEETNVQLFDIAERLHAVEDKQARTTIKAPVSGIIFNLAIFTEGGVITPGTAIMDIVPEDEQLIIRAQVSPLDIDRIQIDAIAEVRFSAFSSKTTPTMEGRVEKISADSLVDQSTGGQYYLANITLTDASQEKLGTLKLIPGMPVEVLINTGERTLFEYLLQPISDAFARSFIEE
ncbi:MAG: HlyD family type I secretion periplasmic adaptor subunit [Methylococcaceae bacterium]|nr:HlyD family type I secretion periplasmic adaptor subunit [Methylococcaceae bacterium]